MSRNFPQARVTRPNTLRLYDEITSGTEKYIKPALSYAGEKAMEGAKYAGKEVLKGGTGLLPVVGQGLGLATGAGISAVTNPELIPYLGSAGALAGKKAGQYAQKYLNKEIDKL